MVQNTGTPDVDPEYAAWKKQFIASLTPEERMRGLELREVLNAIPAEERLAFKEALLASLTPQARVRGLCSAKLRQIFTPGELLEGLSAEEIWKALTRDERRELLRYLLRTESIGSSAGMNADCGRPA